MHDARVSVGVDVRGGREARGEILEGLTPNANQCGARNVPPPHVLNKRGKYKADWASDGERLYQFRTHEIYHRSAERDGVKKARPYWQQRRGQVCSSKHPR